MRTRWDWDPLLAKIDWTYVLWMAVIALAAGLAGGLD